MNRKSLVALVATSAVLVPVGAFASTASAAVTKSSSKYFLQGGNTAVKGITVSGYDGKTVYVAVSTNQGLAGNVSVSTTTGLTLPFGYSSFSGSSIAFTGTQAAVNAALASLQASAPSTATDLSVKVTAFEQKDGVAYNPANAHFYKYVPGKITGTNAFAGAAALSEMGLTGYLTSITSSDENDFVASKIQGSDGTVAKNVWIGASDADTEGDWIWKGGPDNGVQFWKGCNVANGGAAVNGRFSSWASGEPNNWNASLCQQENSPTLGEDCAIINKYSPTSAPPNNAFFVKEWNDLPCSYGAGNNDIVSGYVAEFGNLADGGNFTGVDTVDSSMAVAVPAAKPTFLDRLFSLFGFKKTSLAKNFKITVKKPKTKKTPAKTITCPTKAKKTRFSYTLSFTEAGRYSFYFTSPNGKRIPMECGTKIKTRVITQPISAPVIQSVKDNERPVITAYINTASVGKTQYYPLLNVILKRPDGTLVRQEQPNPPLKGTPVK